MSNIDKTIIPTVEYADVSVQRNIQAGGNITAQGNAIISHNLTVKGWLEANNIKGVNKGLFSDLSHLENAYPFPEIGWFAGVSATAEEITALNLPSIEGQSYFVMYICEADKWKKEPSGKLYRIEVDIAQVNALEEDVNQLRINVNACSSATNQNKEQIQSLKTQVSENAKQIESNKQGVEQAKVDAADAKQTVNALEQEVQTLKTRADSHDTSINNVSFRVDANSDKITNLVTKLNEAQTKIATNQLEISTLNTKVSSKADLSNSEQSISAKKVLVTGGYIIDNQGEEATISYDGGIQDGNSFLKFTDTQNAGLIKLVFDGTEDTIVTQNQFDSRINPISLRVGTIEQDMDYINEDIPNLKLRCDNLEEDAKIVLASMGTAVDNEGNNSDVSIMYVPSVGDRYYDTSTGHIKWVKSSTITEDLGLPSEDRIYCNRMTKRLYVYKNGWKKVGETNDDLSKIKSDIQLNTNSIETINSVLGTIEQDMDYINEDIPNLKLRCDNLEEDAKIVLASMGTAVDNEGNNSDVSIMYVPSVGDRYYDTSTGHIKWVKSSTITEDLGLPSEDRIYCNRMTKRLYVYKNGWKKVGETNDDLSKIKSDIQLNTNSIETINSVLGTKRNEIEYVKQDTDLLLGTAKNKFIVLATNLSIAFNKTTLGFSEGEFNEVYFLLDDSNKLYISGWDIYSSEDVVLEPGYQYLIHIVNHYMTFTKLNTSATNAGGDVAV